MCKVSVLMPAYNAELYIYKSIKSVLKQSYKNFELIIVDDGSTDRTIDIIKSFSDLRIKLYENQENKGLPYTRNKLISLATGEYIALLDSDDICCKKRLEVQVKYLKNNTHIDVVGSNFVRFGKKYFKFGSVETDFKKLKVRLIFMNGILNSSAMMRASFIKENNICYRNDFKVVQDYAFWVDCTRYGNVTNMNKVLVKYRTGHENITKKSKTDKADTRKNLLEKIHQTAFQINNINLPSEYINNFNFIMYDDNTVISEDELNTFKKTLNIIKYELKSDSINEVIQYVWGKAIAKSSLKKKRKIITFISQRFNRVCLMDLKILIMLVLK